MISLRTKQYAGGSLLFLVLSIAVAGFTYYQISKEGAALETQMEVIGDNKLRQERYNELFAILKKSEVEHETLAGYLLTKDRTINFLNTIETLAKDNRLQLTTNSLEVTPLPNPKFESVNLQLLAEGNRSDVMAFLTILETLPYFSRINEVHLTRKKGQEGELWVATISLLVALHAYDT